MTPFAYWTPEDWQEKGKEADEIRDNFLGWDLTDYGEGRYEEMGLLLFTIRNGNYHRRDSYPKGYAGKIMVIKEGHICPMHFHWKNGRISSTVAAGTWFLNSIMQTTTKDSHVKVFP